MVQFKHRSVVTVDFDKTPIVVGRVLELQKIKVDDEDRRALLIDTDRGVVQVFESFALKEAFDCAEPKDGILIVYLRTKSLKKAGRTLKQFNVQVCGLKPDEPLPWKYDDYVSHTSLETAYVPPQK